MVILEDVADILESQSVKQSERNKIRSTRAELLRDNLGVTYLTGCFFAACERLCVQNITFNQNINQRGKFSEAKFSVWIIILTTFTGTTGRGISETAQQMSK